MGYIVLKYKIFYNVMFSYCKARTPIVSYTDTLSYGKKFFKQNFSNNKVNIVNVKNDATNCYHDCWGSGQPRVRIPTKLQYSAKLRLLTQYIKLLAATRFK